MATVEPSKLCPCDSGRPFKYCHGVVRDGPTFRRHAEMGNLMTEFAFQLVADGPVESPDQFYIPAATATLIGPHLAITAKHVIEDYAKQFNFGMEAKENVATCTMTALMFMADNKTGIALPVTNVSLCEKSDIAVLRLGNLPDPPPFTIWTVPEVTLFPPSAGDFVSGCGYYDAVAVDDKTIRREFATTRGSVLNIFPHGRDRVMLPFPCFSLDFAPSRES